MYKKISIILTVLFISISINQNVLKAQETVKPDNRGVISVTGTASENLPSDTAIIVLSINTTSKNAKDAVINNSKKADKVMSAMKELIKQGDKIKTSSYSLQPVYRYDTSIQENILTGYTASNQLTITTKQINSVGTFIDKATASGANQVQNISFILENNSEYCNRLLAKAATNARSQAEAIARTLGVKITGIKQVNGSCGSDQYCPRVFSMAKGAAMAEAAPATPIEAGEVKLNSNVNVDFYAN